MVRMYTNGVYLFCSDIFDAMSLVKHSAGETVIQQGKLICYGTRAFFSDDPILFLVELYCSRSCSFFFCFAGFAVEPCNFTEVCFSVLFHNSYLDSCTSVVVAINVAVDQSKANQCSKFPNHGSCALLADIFILF